MTRFAVRYDTPFVSFFLLCFGCEFSRGPIKKNWAVRPEDEVGDFLLVEFDFVRAVLFNRILNLSVTMLQTHRLSVSFNHEELNIESRPSTGGPDLGPTVTLSCGLSPENSAGFSGGC
ncbi:hypothetical protein AYI68_g7575 [Smittium mucronatum]|uniref:Uncharacterized protein n=1 Tax=Smittium mucronatum TaxID=133383 RepID=A0A1R0GNC1_9FUNG|nr:hypothetical protein AYI68_g7575 [Smittium mucronatum]